MRQLVSTAEAVPCSTQPTKPCSDCPFSRYSVNGWLGGGTPESFISIAMSDSRYDCHALIGPQCAGMGIFRGNICKTPRDKSVLRLPADRTLVFATPKEFMDHHTSRFMGDEDEA